MYKQEYQYVQNRFRPTSYQDFLKWQEHLTSASREYSRDNLTRRTSALSFSAQTSADYRQYEEKLKIEAEKEEKKIDISQ